MITPGSSVITRVVIMVSVQPVNQPGTLSLDRNVTHAMSAPILALGLLVNPATTGTPYLMAVVEQRALDSS